MIGAIGHTLSRRPIDFDIGGSGLLTGARGLDNEFDGLGIDFTYRELQEQFRVKDTVTAANDYRNVPYAKLTYTSPSLKMTRQSDGVWRYVNHNLLTRSEDLGIAWIQNNVTINANSTTAPDGTATADKVEEDNTTNSHRIYNTFTSVVGGIYQWSVYAKAAERTWVIVNAEADDNKSTWFQLSGAGTVGTNAAGNSATITALANGWYRLTLTRVAAIATLSYCILHVSTGDGTSSYAGSTGSGAYFWGAEVKRLPVQEGSGTAAGTYATGYLATTTTAKYDLPYEWNAAGVSQGILIEEQRTNKALRSQDFSTTWATATASISSNTSTAPDGTTTADTLIEDGSNSRHIVYQNITVTGGTTASYSIFAKATGAGSTRYLSLDVYPGAVAYISAIYDLSGAGSVTKTQSGAGGTIVSTSISAEANGWYRCTIVGSVSDNDPYWEVGLSNSGTATIASTGEVIYAGDSTSGLYLWGAQMETSAFPTSPIHTIAATVTRAVDNINELTSTLPFSATTGTLYAKFKPINVAAIRLAATIDDGTVNERFAIGSSAAAAGLFTVIDGGTEQGPVGGLVTGTVTANADNKVAASWVANDLAVAVNGSTAALDTTATLPTVTSLKLGYADASVLLLNGWLSQVAYYKRTMADVELQDKTR